MTDIDARQALATEVRHLLAPLAAAATDAAWRRELLAELGWNLDDLTGFPTDRLTTLWQAVATAYEEIGQLAAAPTTDLAAWRPLLTALRRCFDAVRALRTAFDGWGGPALPDMDRLGVDLVNWLVIRYLRRERPVLGAAVFALALVDAGEDVPAVTDPTSGHAVRFSSSVPRLRLDRLPELVADPVGTLRGHYLDAAGLATRAATDAAADRIFPALVGLLNQLEPVIATYGRDVAALGPDGVDLARHMMQLHIRTGDGLTTEAGLRLSLGLSSAEDGGLGLVVVPDGGVELDRAVGDWHARLTAALQAATVVAVGPDGLTTDLSDGADVRIRAELELIKSTSDGAVLRLGGESGTRLELRGPLRVTGFADLTGERQDFGVEVSSAGGRLVVAASDGDGFLQRVLPPDAKLDFPLGLGWSRQRGLYLTGSGALRAGFDVGAGVGDVASLDRVELSVDSSTDAETRSISMSATASGQVRLGPVAVRVDGVGVNARLAFPDAGGNLGPADLDLGFQPPRGLAMRIDGGAVTGAGFLSYDAAAQKYAGGVDLEFAKLRLSALGLLATRMPDGRPGFSLLVVVNARFPQPIALGFGFNLAAVGGLVGINRAVDVEKLRSGLRTGSLTAILAPGDAVGDERHLLEDLETLFPVTPGRHVFGPTARITWGVPTVVTMDLGLAMELPQPLRFIAAGRVRMLLPDERAPIAVINMDALGVLDTGEGTLSLDATLYDSQIAGWRLTGDMALRARWSHGSVFVMSAGGFHPRFRPPSGFPALRRIALAIGEDDVRLRLEAYLALTSNTLQLGARVEVYAAMGDVSATGTFTFDALVTFSPFGFEVDLSLAVAVRWKGKLLFGVTADLHVEGPGRWYVRGKVTVELLGIKASKRFTASFGHARELPPAPPQDVAALVRTALAEPSAWHVEELAPLPALTMRGGLTLSEFLVSPSARVSVRQTVAPVGDTELARFGQASIVGDRRVRVDGARLGGVAAETSTVYDEFAPAQFFDLSDEEKLTWSSFDLLPSGITFTATETRGYDRRGPAAVTIAYQTLVVDQPDAPAVRVAPTGLSGGDVLSGADLDALAHVGAAGRAETRSSGLSRFDAPGLVLSVGPDAYLVVSAATLHPAGPKPEPGESWSRSEATQRLRRWMSEHPAEAALTVIPAYEVTTTTGTKVSL